MPPVVRARVPFTPTRIANSRRSAWDDRARSQGETVDREQCPQRPTITLRPGDAVRSSAYRRKMMNNYRQAVTREHVERLKRLRAAALVPSIASPADSPELTERMAAVRNKGHRLAREALGAEPTRSLSELTEQVADLHFQLGCALAPIYAHFADRTLELLSQWGYLRNSKVVLGATGRDMLGGLIALRRLQLLGEPMPRLIRLPISFAEDRPQSSTSRPTSTTAINGLSSPERSWSSLTMATTEPSNEFIDSSFRHTSGPPASHTS
jgi:hypothetical protein